MPILRIGKKRRTGLTALDVARYFLSKNDEESGELISNLKLQKLLYYAQGFHLAMYGKPLYEEDIEAWTHGPVVASVYHHYKDYASGAIPPPEVGIDIEKFDANALDLLDEIYSLFGQFSAWKLRNMTHDEPPWKITYEKKPGGIIPHSLMTRYFKTLIEK